MYEFQLVVAQVRKSSASIEKSIAAITAAKVCPPLLDDPHAPVPEMVDLLDRVHQHQSQVLPPCGLLRHLPNAPLLPSSNIGIPGALLESSTHEWGADFSEKSRCGNISWAAGDQCSGSSLAARIQFCFKLILQYAAEATEQRMAYTSEVAVCGGKLLARMPTVALCCWGMERHDASLLVLCKALLQSAEKPNLAAGC